MTIDRRDRPSLFQPLPRMGMTALIVVTLTSAAVLAWFATTKAAPEAPLPPAEAAQANEKTVTAARYTRCRPMLNVRISTPPARIVVAHHNVGRGVARYSRAADGWHCERRDRRS